MINNKLNINNSDVLKAEAEPKEEFIIIHKEYKTDPLCGNGEGHFLRTSIELITDAKNKRNMKALALYHLLRSKHTRPILYNYKAKAQEVASTCGISGKTFLTYIDAMLINGWAKLHKNHSHIELMSTTELKHNYVDAKRGNCLVLIEQNDTVQDVAHKLYGKLLEQHLKHLAHERSLQKIKNLCGNSPYNVTGHECPLTSFSISSASQLFGLNARTVMKIFKTLQRLEIIKITKSCPVKLCEGNIPVKYIDGYARTFNWKGCTFIQQGSIIELLQFPMKKSFFSYIRIIREYKKSRRYDA